MEQLDLATLGPRIWAFVQNYLPKVLLALVVLWIGLRIINMLVRLMRRGMDARHLDATLQRFLGNLVGWALKAMLFISVIQMLGVATTSFVAVLGAAGLAVGLALQGTLANFAGGVLILIFRPFKVGDLVEAQGVLGNVKEIQIFTTILLTPENKTAIIPNGAMANGNIINYSKDGRMRVDLTFGLNYESPVNTAREVLVAAMREVPNVLQDPAPSVTVSKLNIEGMELAVRPWCAPEHYWDVYFGVYEAGIQAIQKAGLKGPQPSVRVLGDRN
ncbi:MAG: mechanosensitive ion channel [Flavobacteriales bacterium]|nr:mechanosensitive ion channel [Flavobacteriales bacterium]MCB9168686.1 mechanosensitive ion channel [Flavobacteriales bacterium]